MYGLVNKAIKDLVESTAGAEAWKAICNEVGHSEINFRPMDPYPDELTYKLVGAVSKALGADAATVLNKFGKYWILFTAKEGYGDLMSMFGNDFITCMKNLNSMHTRMGTMMPKLIPPRFVVKDESAGVYLVEYHSKRQGLVPFVKGLLEGLAEKFAENVKVEHLENSTGETFEKFRIRKVQ